MRRSHNLDRGGLRSASPLIVRDLCAQMAPLNRYGLPSLGVAVAEGVLGLLRAARTAVRAVVSRFCERNRLHLRPLGATRRRGW